jgi:hypothetical protein
MEKGIFIFSIVAISFIGFVSMKRPTTQKAKSPVKASFFKNVLDTLPVQKDEDVKDTVPAIGVFTNISSIVNKDDNSETKTITANDKNGEKYKIIMKNDELLELYVNDKKIPPEEINKYEKLITAIEQAAEYRQKEDMIKMKMAQVEQNKKMKELDAERNELMERLSALDAERAELEHERNKQSTDHEWEDAAGLKYLDDLKMKMRNEDLKNQTFDQLLYDNKQELLRKNAKTDEFFQKQLFDEKEKTFDNNYENPILNELKENILQKQLFNEKALNNEYKNPLLNNRDAFENYQQQLLKENMFQNNLLEQEQRTNILIDPIIQEMVMENIIPPHQEEVSFELNDKAFIVNGKKQPSEVHERFKKKYLKNEGDYFKFSRKDGHTSTTIHLK